MTSRKPLIGLYDALEGIPKTAEGYQAIQFRPNAGDLAYTVPGTLLSTGSASNFDVWMFGGMSPEACNERYSRLVLFLPCRMTGPEMDNGWSAETYRWVTSFIRRLKIPVISAAESVLTNSNDYRTDFHRQLPAYIVDYLRALSEQCVSIGARGEYSAQVIRNLGIDNVEPVGCASLMVNGPALPASLLQRKPFEEVREIALGYTNNVYGDTSLIGPMLQLAADQGHYFIEQQFSLLTKLLYWPKTLTPGDLQRGRSLYQGLAHVNRLLQQGRVRYFTHYGLWNDFSRGLDFMYGSRLHGGIMAINAGVPSYFISQDARLREVCEFYQLPWTTEGEVHARGIDVRRFHEESDYGDACRIYPQRYRNYLDFLRRNGIEPSLDEQGRAPLDVPPPAPGVTDEREAGESFPDHKLALIDHVLRDADAGRSFTKAQLAQITQDMQRPRNGELSTSPLPSMSLANPLIREDIQRIAARLPSLEALRDRHLLLTGGTGFFGKWLLALCEWLDEQGWNLRVTVISRDPERFLRAQPRYRQCPWLRWLAADIRNLPITDMQADFLLHAATDSSVTGQADRLALFDTLYQGTRQVLELAVRSGVSRVLLTGSGAQYGNALHNGGWSESDSRACASHEAHQVYGEGKRVQEMLGAIYADRHGFDVVHTRGFAFGGPGLPLDAHFAIGNFVRDALHRDAIVLDSAGDAIRSYLHGADLAAWLLFLLVNGKPGEVYNVGSDEAISIAELAARVGSRLAPHKPVRISGEPGDTRSHYVPDIGKARALGLDVWTTLGESIDSMGRWASKGGPGRDGVPTDENSSIGSTCVTDWTSIGGGRCQGEPWRVGIAGFSLAGQQAFLLDDADWTDLENQLPVTPLALYGQGNGLVFECVVDAQTDQFDAVLLIAHERRGQPILHHIPELRRYLLLRSAAERASVADESAFAKLFIPSDQPFNDERLVSTSQFVNISGWHAYLPHATPAGQQAEPDYPNTYFGSADFWINGLTAAIAADAATVRGTAPLLSVIIPAYNYGRFLGQCVQSVLDQGVDDIEILVLDNASTDETSEVMAAFRTEPRVRYLRNRHNCGAGHNWRNGLWIAQGRYFTFLSADDYFNEGHLARLLPVLESHPHVAVGYTGVRWVNGQGQLLNQPRHPGYRSADYVGDRNEVADLLIHDCYMTPSAVIYRREAFRKTWRPGNTYGAGDWEMVVQMAEQYPDFAYVDTPGVSYRWHGAQESGKFYASTEPLEGHLTIVDGVFQRNAQHHLKGREREVAAHIKRRLALYPGEQASPLGARAQELIKRLEALAQEHEASLFSIILTTYNRPALLQDALASIDAQSLRDFEVILVNDHGEPVESLLVDFDFPITYLYQGRNRGPAAARNTALHLARGRYVVYLDDDDRYLSNHLQVLAQAIEAWPDGVVYTDAVFITETLEEGERLERAREQRYPHDDYSKERLFVNNYIPINTFACPRSLAASVGFFDESLQGLEDWDFLMRLAARAPFRHVHAETVEVRLREADLDPARRSQQAFKNYPELYRELYSRHSDLGSAAVRKERRELLGRFGISESTQRRGASLQEWLQERSLTVAQRELIEARLQEHGQGPSFGVLILDREGNSGKLSNTLASLRQLEGVAENIQPVVLTIAQAAVRAFTGQVVRVIAGNWADSLNGILHTAEFDWVTLVHAGDEFTTNGFLMAGLELLSAPDCRAVYCDEMYRQTDGSLGAALRPAFNLDYLLSFPAGMAHHWLFRRDVLVEAGGFDADFPEALEFDLILRLINAGGLDGLGHIAEPLLITDAPILANVEDEQRAITRHLQGRGYQQAQILSTQPGRYQICYGHVVQPMVSLLIMAGNQLARLQRCVESLLEVTRYPHYELLLIESDPTATDVHDWMNALEGLGEARLRTVWPTSPQTTLAAAHNLVATQAKGDYLLLLSPDTAAIDSAWLDELVNHALRPEVGAVGAKLLTADGRVRHAGLILGLEGTVGRSFLGEPLEAPGYMQRLQVDQNYSALSGECLMIRTELFIEAGGFDEAPLLAPWVDVDLCLRLQEAGYLNVWVPRVRLLVDTSGGSESTPAEEDALFAKWLPRLARDPAYNPGFSLQEKGGFKLAPIELSWRPLQSWRPLPTVLAYPVDSAGCGHYRVIQPHRALHERGMIDGELASLQLSAVDLERYDADAIIVQRQVTNEQLDAMRRMRSFSRAFKIYELDDYLPNLPLKSIHRQDMPKDILKSLRRGFSLVDRLVVSTEALADAYAGMHGDIRVVENRLPSNWWGGLKSKRRVGAMPRVGWAGGISHTGDLDLIADVVKELASEVEWVFFGMCPDRLRPYISEFHPGIQIDNYPQALARLNLDLALAPVEQNLFNECKSNLRLLEYGACGFPVICSDVRCYQGDGLPVTRVKNRFRDWVDAIRAHINDLDAAAKVGDELRIAVLSGWMLEGENLGTWRKAWLPD